jgi:glycosyltransferase involved in cell wall biosynthesis
VLVDPHDTAVFADRLAHLLSDTALRKKIHDAQNKRIKDFDVPVVGGQLLTIYEREIANRLRLRDNESHE